MRQANSTEAGPIIELLGDIGVVLDDLDILLGIDCSPITGVGVGSSGSTVACCESNEGVSIVYFILSRMADSHIHDLRNLAT